MTTLLVVGLIALVFGMARTAKQMSEKGKAKAVIQDVVGEGEINLPAGSRLLSTTADQGRLFLTLDTNDGQMILIVDARDGRELGRLLLIQE
jgi:hypothetical protein